MEQTIIEDGWIAQLWWWGTNDGNEWNGGSLVRSFSNNDIFNEIFIVFLQPCRRMPMTSLFLMHLCCIENGECHRENDDLPMWEIKYV